MAQKKPEVFSPAQDEYEAAKSRLRAREVARLEAEVELISRVVDALMKETLISRRKQIKRRALAAIRKADLATGRR